MKKILLAVGLVMASLSFASVAKNNDNNPYGDVTVIGNGTGSVSISQCASTWNCNNSELNVDFTGDVENVIINGEHTVIKGKDGVNGLDGKDGINGTNGKDGIDGKDGAQGIQGEKGDTGATGAAGADGKDGINGKDGTNGIDGKDGRDGVDGAAGRDGIDGKDGKDGRDGVDGKDGAQGIQGEKGDKGDTGAAGKDGVNGTDGINGTNGTNGVDGINGKDGQNGINGVDGINGINGTNGTDGANGKDADMTLVNANTAANKATAARQESYEKSTNQRFADMGKRIDDNRNHASAGIAGVAAMANIPQVSQNSSFSIGAGVGSYDGEQGIAVGASARFNQNIVTKASVAGTTQSDFVFGAGVSYEW